MKRKTLATILKERQDTIEYRITIEKPNGKRHSIGVHQLPKYIGQKRADYLYGKI